jgi:hypothetical protein
MAISLKRFARPLLDFLSQGEMQAILQAMDNSWSGRRNHPFFLFLYNNGARVPEALSVRVPNCFGRPVTRTAVQQRFQLHVQTAQANCPSLRQRRISSDAIRHYLPFLIMSCNGGSQRIWTGDFRSRCAKQPDIVLCQLQGCWPWRKTNRTPKVSPSLLVMARCTARQVITDTTTTISEKNIIIIDASIILVPTSIATIAALTIDLTAGLSKRRSP